MAPRLVRLGPQHPRPAAVSLLSRRGAITGPAIAMTCQSQQTAQAVPKGNSRRASTVMQWHLRLDWCAQADAAAATCAPVRVEPVGQCHCRYRRACWLHSTRTLDAGLRVVTLASREALLWTFPGVHQGPGGRHAAGASTGGGMAGCSAQTFTAGLPSACCRGRGWACTCVAWWREHGIDAEHAKCRTWPVGYCVCRCSNGSTAWHRQA